jgi:hypothetical protein
VAVGCPPTGQLADEETPSMASRPAGVEIWMPAADAEAVEAPESLAELVLIVDASATRTS